METAKDEEELSPDPAEILPEVSVLSFKEYIDMQRAVGEETRYRLLHYLTTCGDASPKELKQALDLRRNTLHHHLNKLVDVGLVQKRARNEANSDGLFTYYRASAFGEVILEHGVKELMQMEEDFREMYGAAEDST
jgi:ArsR family transcriptional regulator